MAALGIMLTVDWKVALLCLLAFILVVLTSRMVSLGSIIAVLCLVVLTFLFRQYVYGQPPEVVWFVTLCTVFITVIIITKHGGNIKRIANGTERKLSFHKE